MGLVMTYALPSHLRARVGVGSSAKRIKGSTRAGDTAGCVLCRGGPPLWDSRARTVPLEAGGGTCSRADVSRGRVCTRAFGCDSRQRGVRIMKLLPPGVKVHLAFGFVDMRKGIDGLAMLVQGVLRQDPFSGHLFVFRGRKANLIKIVFWDGTGLCLFTKRLEHGVFLWPSNVEPGGTLMLNSAQLSMLIDGVDWRAPERQWRPAVAG